MICISNSGYHIAGYSDGVTVLTDPPLSHNAFLLVSTSSLTQFESRDGFLPSSDVTLYWGGFEESSGAPLAFEVWLLEGGVAGNWTNVGHIYSLTLADLSLEVNTTHTVELRAINLAGLPSNSLARNFTIVSSPPEFIGSATGM